MIAGTKLEHDWMFDFADAYQNLERYHEENWKKTSETVNGRQRQQGLWGTAVAYDGFLPWMLEFIEICILNHYEQGNESSI